MTEKRFFKDGPDYVNEFVLPVCDSSIKPEYVLQVFVGACLNAACWWLDKAFDTNVVDAAGEPNDVELEQVEKYIRMITSMLPYLPQDPDEPNARSSVIEELSGLMTRADELHAMVDEVKAAIAAEKEE
jgi:hypothetical protein